MAREASVDWVAADDVRDELMTGEAVALDLRPTGFALRAAGTLIDFAVYMGSYVLILIGIGTLAARVDAEPAVFGILGVVALAFCLLIAPTTVEVLSHGKSLGRLAVGARIVRDDGGAIGLRHASIRALVGLLEIYFTIGAGAVLFGLLSPRTKRLGDLVAGTYSQYERVGKELPQAFGIPMQLAAWSTTADVARMPDGLSRRISQFLMQAAHFTPDRRAYLARDLAAEAAAFVSPLPDVDPELFLAGLTVVRRERELAALQLEAERLKRLEPALRGLPHGFPERG
ncbi:RDD family protein [soil metagenome]